MKKRESQVPVQKGRIEGNPQTMKQMTHPERLREREGEVKELRRGQHLDLHTPKK